MLFLHPQRFQWHNDDPLYDNLRIIRNVQLPYLTEQGYVNLRCVWWLGCPVEIRPYTDTHREDIHAGEHYMASFKTLFPGEVVPNEVGASCCAQFGVTRDQVRRRTREEYQRYRQWLLHTTLADEMSGRIMEYTWHSKFALLHMFFFFRKIFLLTQSLVIFRQNSVHCPTAQECYCKVFGQCNLTCPLEGGCDGRYPIPVYSTLPENWPYIGWDGQPQEQLPL